MKKKRNGLIRRKIKSEEGASLSVALLFFLVCAIVGSVILAAAASSMGRMKNLSSTERDKEAVYSTARLVVRRMAGKNLADDKILPQVLGLTANKDDDKDGDNGVVCNAEENTLTTSTQFSFYRRVNGDGTYVDSAATGGAGETTEDSNRSQAVTSDYLNGRLPGSPFANLKKNLNTKNLNLTGYEIVRAGEIIDVFWNDYVLKDDGKLGQDTEDPGFSTDNGYQWVGDHVPGNHTWMYGHTDSLDSSWKNSLNTSFKKQSYILNVDTGKDNEAIKVCVDFYMDRNLNIEAQIYSYKADKSGKQTSTFKNASARCLVKIPANGGELQYTQYTNTDTEEAQSTKEAQSTEEAQSTDHTDDSITYKVTITRSVTLSGFGWGNAKVYTGSAIAAQNPTGL